MLGRLLNAGRVNQAIMLSNLFEHGSPNLASVLVSVSGIMNLIVLANSLHSVVFN